MVLVELVGTNTSGTNATGNGGVTAVMVLLVGVGRASQGTVMRVVGGCGRGPVVMVAWQGVLDLVGSGRRVVVVIVASLVVMLTRSVAVMLMMMLVHLVSANACCASATDNGSVTTVVVLVVGTISTKPVTSEGVAGVCARRRAVTPVSRAREGAARVVARRGTVIISLVARKDRRLDLVSRGGLSIVAVAVVAVIVAITVVLVVVILVELVSTKPRGSDTSHDAGVAAVMVLVVLVSRAHGGVVIDVRANLLATSDGDGIRVLEVCVRAGLQAGGVAAESVVPREVIAVA